MAASSTLYGDEYPLTMEDNSTEKFPLTPVVSSSSPDDEDDGENSNMNQEGNNHNNTLLTAMKLIVATALFYSAGTSFAETYHQMNNNNNNYVSSSYNNMPAPTTNNNQRKYANGSSPSSAQQQHRRLSEISKKNPPSYMKDLMDDLNARTKLMKETPPEEVKYWFEYTGPLQVCYVHMSFFNLILYICVCVIIINYYLGEWMGWLYICTYV